MTWTKLDDGFWSNPKIELAGNEAAGVYARCLSYCGHHETDGAIPPGVARYIGPPKAWKRLEEVGLIESLNGTGFRIPDYLDFNPSKAVLEEKRRKDRERKAGGS